MKTETTSSPSPSLLTEPPRIREAFSARDLPEQPRSFIFFGTRAQLAAGLILDAEKSGATEFVIFAERGASEAWSVWRR